MDKQLNDAAADILQIRAVLLRSSSITVDEKILPPDGDDFNLNLKYRSGPAGPCVVTTIEGEDGATGSVAVFKFFASVKLVDQAREGDAETDEPTSALQRTRLSISAEFGATYALKPGVDIEAVTPALQEFAKANVGYHVWPYWREYVQSICARMGIPIIPVRTYRMPKERKKGEGDDLQGLIGTSDHQDAR